MGSRAYLAALPPLLNHETDLENFRVYVTDALRLAFQLNLRYADMIDRKPRKEVKPGEAARSIRAKLGGE